ncbi:hypothetical protein SCLCIDRAFT_7201 [Scleroderma citrinum Foug A]|uniref:Uncharacterized protein n=1 Tax=Scleroderma citrinum Foug A TaxID=1036808 RepID=A0A0C3A4D8_9AGAM|nr:hypothetical protein SCLCIDRAFT_7201 [Scleroderma citrinum Foug A]
MGKQLKRKCILSSSEDEDVPFSQALSQVQPLGSSFYVDSVLGKAFSKPFASSSINSHSFQSSSAPLFTSYKQASHEANKGLKGKGRSTRSTSGQTPGNMDTGLTNAEISRLEAINLAHSDFHNYFEFDRDFSKVDSKLCSLFTGLFSYFNNDCPKIINPTYCSFQDPCYQYFPLYLLCIQSQKEIAVVGGVDYLTGEIVFEKVRAGKRPSQDKAELIFNKIPHKVMEKWTHTASKGKGKRVELPSDSDIDDFESRKANSDSDAEFQTFISENHPKQLHTATKTSSVSITSEPAASSAMIDLTEDHSSSGADVFMALSPESNMPVTTPSTPTSTQAIPLPLVSGSFTIDKSLSNPWKSGQLTMMM